MTLDYYRFSDTWSLPVPPATVFHTLLDIGEYPSWWSDVRAVTEVNPETAEIICRSLLPYQLRLHARRGEQDEPAGRLRLELTGDLEGYVGCVVEQRTSGTRLRIAQEVRVRKWLLRRLSPVARPLLRANHAVMMRRGERGLRAHLGGGAATRRPRAGER